MRRSMCLAIASTLIAGSPAGMTFAQDEQGKQGRHHKFAEFHDLLRQEMVRVDPSLKPVLEKLSELRKHADLDLP